jgi:hypothetical protein
LRRNSGLPTETLEDNCPYLPTENTTEEEMADGFRVLITVVAILETVTPPPFPRPTRVHQQQPPEKNLCSPGALVFHSCRAPRGSEEPRNMAPYAELAHLLLRRHRTYTHGPCGQEVIGRLRSAGARTDSIQRHSVDDGILRRDRA